LSNFVARYSAEGTIRFTYPGIHAGEEVEDVKLTFKEGKVVKASAVKGNDLLQETLKIDGATISEKPPSEQTMG